VTEFRRQYEPPQSGPLRLRELVRASTFALRHLTQVTLDTLSPPRQVRAAQLDLELVKDVERALKCRLPDEILACLANGDDELQEFGFVLGQVADHTTLARQRPEVPEGLTAVIEQMMTKAPELRYQLPREVVAALMPWLQVPIAPPAEQGSTSDPPDLWYLEGDGPDAAQGYVPSQKSEH
jgi:hypothetical protein